MKAEEREAKILKLPQWTQMHINKLEKDVEYYKNQMLTLTGEKPTNVCVFPFMDDPSIFFKDNTTFSFDISGNKHGVSYYGSLHVQLKEYGKDDKRLQIMTAGGGRLSLRPEAGNVISVVFED